MNFVVALTVAFSGLLECTPGTRYIVIGALAVQVVALYLHAYNVWRTMRRGFSGG